MSRAHDYLKQVIHDALGDQAESFWTEYRKLSRMDARDNEAQMKRRHVATALRELAYWQSQLGDDPRASSQIKRWEESCERARAWLAKYGYTENEA